MDTITYNKMDNEYKSLLSFGHDLSNMIQKEIERSEKWLLDNYGLTLKEGSKKNKEFRDKANKEYHEYLKQLKL